MRNDDCFHFDFARDVVQNVELFQEVFPCGEGDGLRIENGESLSHPCRQFGVLGWKMVEDGPEKYTPKHTT